jgi:NTP pyrophosphatase (non-canonical NTP hydrolase)
MILALLPGLEEEAGEFFEKVQAYRLRCMFAY